VTGAYVVTTMEELLSLKWNNHKSTFIHVLGILRDKQLYTDATLACEGKFYNAHKLVLSTCSDYFSAMLDRTNCKNPVIVLKDIRSEDLEALLDYMYLGEVNVRQSDLATLIKAAECLRVKGLAVPDDEPPPRKAKEPRRDASASSPPAKRKRRSDVDDGRDDVRNVRQDNHKPSPSIRSTNIQNLDNSPNNSESNSTNNASNMNIGNNLPSMNDSNAASSERVSKAEYSKETFNNSDDSVSAIPPVKVEVIDDNDVNTDNADSIAAGDSGSYLDNDDFKEEDPQELSSDLPEFLQQASGSFPQGFPGTSFQPDLWQGDGSNGNFAAATSMAYDNQNNTSAGRPEVRCSVCGREISGRNRNQRLAYHMLTHSGEKRHACPHCPYRAALKFTLDRHVRGVHRELWQQALQREGVVTVPAGSTLARDGVCVDGSVAKPELVSVASRAQAAFNYGFALNND